jgi:sugar O-acyltransferase (sialic acid O-acetyltransferase NeuD family)
LKKFIYGAGGHSKVVLEAMRKSNFVCDGFIDDSRTGDWMGLPVFKAEALEIRSGTLHIAIGNCNFRAKIAETLYNFEFISIYHPDAIISVSSEIQKGTFLAAGSIIAPDVKIGTHCIINHNAVVDHDCLLGNFTHIAPNATLGGGVTVGKSVLIGSGAVLLPGITIGDYAIVGAGSVVTSDIASGVTVLGNPARAI